MCVYLLDVCVNILIYECTLASANMHVKSIHWDHLLVKLSCVSGWVAMYRCTYLYKFVWNGVCVCVCVNQKWFFIRDIKRKSVWVYVRERESSCSFIFFLGINTCNQLVLISSLPLLSRFSHWALQPSSGAYWFG